MKKLIFFSFLIIPASLQAGGLVSTSTVWEVRADATAGNINGGGYSTHDIPTPGIDYSKQTIAQKTILDLVIGGAGSENTVSSSLTPFDANDPGNVLHITAGTGFTAGWYTIRSVSAGVATLVSAAGTAGSSNGTGQVGGALSMNSTLDDDVFENFSASNTMWLYQGGGIIGSGEVISMATVTCTVVAPCTIEGYYQVRGDRPNTLDTRPQWNFAANSFAATGANSFIYNYLDITGTAATTFSPSSTQASRVKGSRLTNTSTTVARSPTICGATSSDFIGNELVGQNGFAVNCTVSIGRYIGNYIHDSSTGFFSSAGTSFVFHDNLLEANSVGFEISNSAGQNNEYFHNTFYGAEAPYGIGVNSQNVNATVGHSQRFGNNIYYGLNFAKLFGVRNDNNLEDEENYFNNTNDVRNFFKHPTSLSLDPQFANAKQITGTTGSTSGSVLTQSGGDFSTVVDTFSYLHVTVGGGATVGCYRVVKHDNTTLTVNNALGTGSNTVYFVTTGHNFQVGPNMKGVSYPQIFGSSLTLTYSDMGAVQRPEPQRAILTGGN